MKRWEYKEWADPAVTKGTIRTLREWGEEGWELVTVIQNVQSPRFPRGSLLYFFKREKLDNTAYRGNV